MIDFTQINEIIEAGKRGELLDERESPNRPHPLKGQVQGENRILGLVLPNTEYVKHVQRIDGTVAEIVTADTKLTQDVPRCCIVLQRSRKFDEDEFPDVHVGSYLMFRENSGDYFEIFGVPYVNLSCQFVRFVYEPVGEMTEGGNPLTHEAHEKWHNRYEVCSDVAWKGESDLVEMVK